MVLIDKQLYKESLASITPFDEERIMTLINLVCLLQILLILFFFVKNVHCTSYILENLHNTLFYNLFTVR